MASAWTEIYCTLLFILANDWSRLTGSCTCKEALRGSIGIARMASQLLGEAG
jgi:hypothetical protein